MTDITRYNARVRVFDYPVSGDWYWDRYAHQIAQADHTLDEKFLILELGVELEPDLPSH